MKNTRVWAACAVLFYCASRAQALGPHECIIIVNHGTTESIDLANYYAELRQIPPLNIVHLDLPDKALEAGASFTPDEFRTLIYEPVTKILRERNLANHVLVWLYSLSFPSQIDSDPPLSLTGMTYVRGNPPPKEQIEDGSWISPIYAGPDRADGPKSPAAGFEEFTIRLTTNMPIPSMMLGWSGSRGMRLSEIKDQLRRSASADGSHPSASVFFETTDDVRSGMRQWQFAPAAAELSRIGVAALTASNPPAKRSDLMGVLVGRPTVEPGEYGPLQPGAYAEHLTSFAGLFHDPYQSKLTEWLRMGAAGSSGTVTEPGSTTKRVLIWAKFPQARLFTHYASGCSLIESLYLATRCPLQLLMVGDALCSPWAKPPGISLVSMAEDEDAPLKDDVEFVASSWGGFGQRPPTTIFFLDGRPVNQSGSKPEFKINSSRLYDGSHDLRVVAYANESIRHQGFDRLQFVTRNRGRSVTLSGYDHRQKVDYFHPLRFQITAEGSPREAAIVVQERVVARELYTNGVTLTVNPQRVGAGDLSFQAVVVYADNEPVRSEPLMLNIQPLNKAPEITAITIATNNEEELVYAMNAKDDDGDDVSEFWYADAANSKTRPLVEPPAAAGAREANGRGIVLAAPVKYALATYEADQPNRVREIRTTMRFTTRTPIAGDHNAGIVFNMLDGENYMYWGCDGQLSAWILVQVSNGQEKRILSRGAFIDTGREHSLSVIALGDQKVGLIADDELLALTSASFSAGRIGVRNGKAAATYSQLLISPANAFRTYAREEQGRVVLDKDHLDEASMLVAGARDNSMFWSSRRVIRE